MLLVLVTVIYRYKSCIILTTWSVLYFVCLIALKFLLLYSFLVEDVQIIVCMGSSAGQNHKYIINIF